jgi:hypothetical protein
MTQLALTLAPTGPDWFGDETPSLITEDNATLLVIAGQGRRRLGGRRAALHLLRWRMEHEAATGPRRRPARRLHAAIESVGAHLDGLAHLDDLDKETAS